MVYYNEAVCQGKTVLTRIVDRYKLRMKEFFRKEGTVTRLERTRQEEKGQSETRTRKDENTKRRSTSNNSRKELNDTSPLQHMHEIPDNTSSLRKQGLVIHTRITPTQRAIQFLIYHLHENIFSIGRRPSSVHHCVATDGPTLKARRSWFADDFFH